MEENKKISTVSDGRPKGFYYDTQLNNPLLTATLHPNTYITNVPMYGKEGYSPYDYKDSFEWALFDPKKVKCLEKLTDNHSGNENPSECYREKPLITAILSEDFQVEVGNMWGDAGGTTPIESAFNQAKGMAAYNKEMAAGLQDLSKTLKENTGILGWIGKQTGNIGSFMEKNVDRLNSALITQGTRFAYYGGTSTTFGNLSMRFTLFADWIPDESGRNYGFKTVHEQLMEIYPYAIGKYSSLNTDKAKELVASYTDNKTANDITDAAGNVIETFFGWQNPPAGFRADVRSLDCCQKGTLRLVMGGYYTAENLIISGMNVNFSKVMTKIPPRAKRFKRTSEKQEGVFTEYSNSEILIDSEHEGQLTPLYADVTISLRPASHYTDNAIINFSSNKRTGEIAYNMTKVRNESLRTEIEKKKEKETESFKMQKIGEAPSLAISEKINEFNQNLDENSKDLLEKNLDSMVFPAQEIPINMLGTTGAGSPKSSIMHGGNYPPV